MLNLGYNQIKRIEGVNGLPNLKALILNDNKIKKIKQISNLSALNTLGEFILARLNYFISFITESNQKNPRSLHPEQAGKTLSIRQQDRGNDRHLQSQVAQRSKTQRKPHLKCAPADRDQQVVEIP